MLGIVSARLPFADTCKGTHQHACRAVAGCKIGQHAVALADKSPRCPPRIPREVSLLGVGRARVWGVGGQKCVIAGDPMRGSWVVGTMTGEGVRRSSMSWHHATGRHVVKWLQRLDVGGRIRCFVRPLVLAGSGAGDGVHGVLATGASAHPIWTSSKVRAVEDCGGRYLLCGLVLTAVADQAAVMRVYFSCVGSEMCSSYRRTALRVP